MKDETAATVELRKLTLTRQEVSDAIALYARREGQIGGHKIVDVQLVCSEQAGVRWGEAEITYYKDGPAK